MSETVQDLLFENNKPKKECLYFVNSCLLCESKKLKQLFKQWGIKYHKCKECGFVFSNPRLTDKGAYKWYNSDYYNAAMQTEHYIAQNFDPFFSISLENILLDKIVEFVANSNFKKNIKIVDIGCGSGTILHLLKDKLGFNNLTGFDLNSSNIEFARSFRKIVMRNVDIYELDQTEKYNLIITTENIEHISNPKEYITQLLKLAEKDSFLLLSAPHYDDRAVKLMGISGDHFCAPNHQNYFNYDNLSRLLTENGFVIQDYWLYDYKRFSILKFFKRFFIKRDQITTTPPKSAKLKNIFKWKKIRNAVIMGNLTVESTIDKSLNQSINNSNKHSFSVKRIIKNIINRLIPIKFKTHQIILARYEGK